MARQTLTGLEILVVDKDDRVLRGLDRLFRDMGLLVTAVSDPLRAQDQLANKFFPVVVIDLDTPESWGGLELLAFAKERSPITVRIVLCGHDGFYPAAEAFRAGATDVVQKTQDAVPYLKEIVSKHCSEVHGTIDRDQLVSKVAEMHQDFLNQMVEQSKRIVDLEDRLVGRDGGSSPSLSDFAQLDVLLVDDRESLFPVLAEHLPAEKGWRHHIARSGGEALDIAGQIPPQIAIVRDGLPDLPASMVVSAIKKSSSDAIMLLMKPPEGSTAGRIDMIEGSRLVNLVPTFSEPRQLVAALSEIRVGIKEKAKERRYLKAFRRENFEFLKKYTRMRADLIATGLVVKDGD